MTPGISGARLSLQEERLAMLREEDHRQLSRASTMTALGQGSAFVLACALMALSVGLAFWIGEMAGLVPILALGLAIVASHLWLTRQPEYRRSQSEVLDN